MNAPALPRRGFLRGLASLPLIGGSVALIGHPTRVATPATSDQLAQYAAFCFDEAMATTTLLRSRGINGVLLNTSLPPEIGRFQSVGPEFRAPLILSAAGLPLPGGRS